MTQREQSKNRPTENRLWLPVGRGSGGGNGLGVWDNQMQTIMHRVDKIQGPDSLPSEPPRKSMYSTGNYVQYL